MDLDCGDNSCRFAKNRGGMRTNGGCRCFENAGFGPSAVGAALQMLPEITRLRAEVDQAHARGFIAGMEKAAQIALDVWDTGKHGAHGGEQANRTADAILRAAQEVGR